ncbi:IEC3 subunit of the ino80 complex, chromatin re-modelling domain-containing protein [Trichoderma breve]|uniref:IEC3 subunit of the ino80 complex, chromatin re-modelling domain-containing protein n=1 Tax=Trichoderma breve TaxID=2034170 RepID=A0A9W9JPI2_9HYPO|nr:IEC3 subunit of the ino80 complex, chromatin re-modelling domain-containing protein [Trichoderma breve]KAJ4863264.1 IEC3 subunit of the ino80 complex, chromatin re-modelling domain-containing protein [Trichoderma breve]
MADSPAKADGGSERRPAGYKSWKKKYRKMRIVFDHKMHECEELHKQEAKAANTVKRLAIENDRLLDLLLEVNNSPQIPTDRRIDLSLKPPSDDNALCLPMDRDRSKDKEAAMKKLEQLLSDIPHSTYDSAKETKSSFLADLGAPDGESHPAHFLSADDIDDYIYLVDTGIDPDSTLPTMAPLAHPIARPPSNPQTKNPTSVTNWLRKHAPKIFLQDGETHGERGGSKASGKGKKAGAAARLSAAAERGDGDASMDDDGDFGATPAARSSKRKRDDDTGYKPRGSSSRPTKKKRKSDVEATPTARKSKKDAAAASKDE